MSSSGEKMRIIGNVIMTEILPTGVGFVLIVCDTENQGYSNYVSNIVDKDKIIVAVEELLEKMKQVKVAALLPKADPAEIKK